MNNSKEKDYKVFEAHVIMDKGYIITVLDQNFWERCGEKDASLIIDNNVYPVLYIGFSNLANRVALRFTPKNENDLAKISEKLGNFNKDKIIEIHFH